MTDPTQISELRGAPLAKAVAEYITAHPEEWDQGQWGIETDCGTTACFAGWTLILTDRAEFERGVLAGSNASVPLRASLLLGKDFDSLFFWDPDEEYREQLELDGLEEDILDIVVPVYDKLKEMWQRVATYYPKGAITIPEDYR